MEPERLQKLLARAGYGSRREIETWIEQGRLRINNQPATLGDRVGPRDHITLDGRPVRRVLDLTRRRVLLYHKPEGEICTRQDPEGRPTVFEQLPPVKNGRWITVGRLDINTSGLLLFSTDGELANRLMHPAQELQREYAVRVLGEVSTQVLQKLQTGVELEDGPARFDSIEDRGGQGVNHWYHVTLHEGRNREVRRLWEAAGVTVNRLIRVRFGNLALPRRLPRGKWQELKDSEIAELLKLAGMTPEPDEPVRTGPKPPTRQRKPATRKPVRARSKPRNAGRNRG